MFTPSESESEIEKDQRTSEKDQRINDKHKEKFSLRVRFPSVWTRLKDQLSPESFYYSGHTDEGTTHEFTLC